jgi:hypothetical protein
MHINLNSTYDYPLFLIIGKNAKGVFGSNRVPVPVLTLYIDAHWDKWNCAKLSKLFGCNPVLVLLSEQQNPRHPRHVTASRNLKIIICKPILDISSKITIVDFKPSDNILSEIYNALFTYSMN